MHHMVINWWQESLRLMRKEAEAIRVIFDQYVNTDIGSNGIAKYLENHGISRSDRLTPLEGKEKFFHRREVWTRELRCIFPGLFLFAFLEIIVTQKGNGGIAGIILYRMLQNIRTIVSAFFFYLCFFFFGI